MTVPILPPLTIRDLLYDAAHGAEALIVGRDTTFSLLAQTFERQQHNNVVIVGTAGVGKTTLLQGFGRQLQRGIFPGFSRLPALYSTGSNLTLPDSSTDDAPRWRRHLAAAFNSLPDSLFFIDDSQALLGLLESPQEFEYVFTPFFTSTRRRLGLVIDQSAWSDLQERFSYQWKHFEVIQLEELPETICQQIIRQRVADYAATYKTQLHTEIPDMLYEQGKQLVSTRAMPDRALRFFDEVSAAAVITRSSHITPEDIRRVFTEKSGITDRNFSFHDPQRLADLPQRLARRLIGQPSVVARVGEAIVRGGLGLKDTDRPLASFLFLGPSGVGKTELAKLIAQEVYGTSKAMIRIDMSEYAEAHNVQRLLGAPPGYVGYESGGQLTTPVKQRPFSLILLDEIEKADRTVFDIFLQLLDDGRLTDGRGETVDFTKTIVIATSNIGVDHIIDQWQAGTDVTLATWRQAVIMPLLRQHFRVEFINRFEEVLTFQPLDETALLAIARLELQKIERRLQRHNVTITVGETDLKRIVASFQDPWRGARPLKRYLAEQAETQLATTLLQHTR